MPYGTDDSHQRDALASGYEQAGLTLEQLWLRYFGLGGQAALIEIEAYLHGIMPLPKLERDILAHSVNERLVEVGSRHRMPYSDLIEQDVPRGLLGALIELLDGMELSPPEHLPLVAAAAGKALGVAIRIYLITDDQRSLVPLSSSGSPDSPSLDVETTLAGRAFRLLEIQESFGEEPRLWIPLATGVERLGVLEISPNAAELAKPTLREHCRRVSTLVAQLVSMADRYGDFVDVARSSRPKTASADLMWRLLPPLGGGTDSFVVGGLLEPAHDLGGDAFDYVLSNTRAALAVFDAMGHSLGAGLMSAAALSSYRAARRSDQDLLGQAYAIDETIGRQFGDDAFVTAVLCDLDLTTGRLRYILAGHPRPLVLREGKVVKVLSDGRRPPLGIEAGEHSIGEETLQPGDLLVLYTDGITEARDDAGEMFGQERLVDFVRRQAAAGYPPPETVRRVITAVLEHQHGVLQDDATVLIARWDRPTQPADRLTALGLS